MASPKHTQNADGDLFDLLGIHCPDEDSDGARPAVQATVLPSTQPAKSPLKTELSLKSWLERRFPYRSNYSASNLSLEFQIDDFKPERDVHFIYCHITLVVPDPEAETIRLELTNPPYDSEVQAVIQKHGGSWTDLPGGYEIVLDLRLTDVTVIRRLAKAIRNVIKVRHIQRTGERYPINNWRWLAGRTAGSLDSLADAVWEFRQKRAEARRSDTRRAQAREGVSRRSRPKRPAVFFDA